MKIKQLCKGIFEYAVLLIIGGTAYYCIELLWRGYSHWSMAVVGGICFISIGLINRLCLEWDMPIVEQMFIAGFIITAVEFVAGVILNIWLKMGIWDYSHMPHNFLGQVCLSYFALWQFLSPVGIVLDDVVRWRLFKEHKPKYRLI